MYAKKSATVNGLEMAYVEVGDDARPRVRQIVSAPAVLAQRIKLLEAIIPADVAPVQRPDRLPAAVPEARLGRRRRHELEELVAEGRVLRGPRSLGFGDEFVERNTSQGLLLDRVVRAALVRERDGRDLR